MVLGFKLMFPWGQKTNFVEKIKKLPGFRPKIHTLRNGFRWRKGMKIHFAIGVRTKYYHQFEEGICEEAQTIKIFIENKDIRVFIDGIEQSPEVINELALNDGFDSLGDFISWFSEAGSPDQIVHWTPFKY